MNIFKLPDLGEGLAEAEIHEWHVKEGDEIKLDEPLVSMETAKAVVEVPSPCDGKILKLHGQPGDMIDTGAPLVEFETTDTAEETKKEPTTSAATVAGKIEVGDGIITEAATGITPTRSVSNGVKALPAVRSLARQLCVDLTTLTGTGPDGQITADNVKQAANIGSAHPGITVHLDNPEALKGTRRSMAKAMSASHAEVVPVTLVDDADIGAWAEKTDITARIIRAVAKACEASPALNGWYDGRNIARELSNDVHLGLAMDTEDGLFVPVIKSANNQSAEQLRETINTYKQQVKDRSIPQENLQGATITLSNFGMFAGRYANPIVVPPMIAIIGTGQIKHTVVEKNGNFASHRVIPLSVTFDHRAATGGEASRFLGAMIEDLQQAQ